MQGILTSNYDINLTIDEKDFKPLFLVNNPRLYKAKWYADIPVQQCKSTWNGDGRISWQSGFVDIETFDGYIRVCCELKPVGKGNIQFRVWGNK